MRTIQQQLDRIQWPPVARIPIPHQHKPFRSFGSVQTQDETYTDSSAISTKIYDISSSCFRFRRERGRFRLGLKSGLRSGCFLLSVSSSLAGRELEVCGAESMLRKNSCAGKWPYVGEELGERTGCVHY